MQLTSAKSKFSSNMLLFPFRSGCRACACPHPFTGWISLFGNKQSDSWDYQINQMKTDFFSLKILCSTILQLFPCKWVWQVLYNVQINLHKQKHKRAWAEIKLCRTNLEQLWGCRQQLVDWQCKKRWIYHSKKALSSTSNMYSTGSKDNTSSDRRAALTPAWIPFFPPLFAKMNFLRSSLRW